MHPESRSWMQILSNHIWFEIKLTCKNNVNIRANSGFQLQGENVEYILVFS